MKRFLLALAAVLGFASQAGSKTQITLDQIAAPTSMGVMVNIIGTGWTRAQIDSTLVIDTSTSPPTLRAPGGGQVVFVDAVTPAGTIDGVNAVFTLPSVPSPAASLEVHLNGMLMRVGVDFNIPAGSSIVTFVAGALPQTGSQLVASYRR